MYVIVYIPYTVQKNIHVDVICCNIFTVLHLVFFTSTFNYIHVHALVYQVMYPHIVSCLKPKHDELAFCNV